MTDYIMWILDSYPGKPVGWLDGSAADIGKKDVVHSVKTTNKQTQNKYIYVLK